MIKAFRISFSLQNTYRVNSIIYSLKQIPLLGRLLPSALYGSRGLKRVITVISFLWEILSAFLGKVLYLFLIVWLPLELYPASVPRPDAYLHILFFLTVIGAMMNTWMFDPTNDKYYAMVLMRMDARAYTLSNYIYVMLKFAVGFLPFSLLFGNRAGVPFLLSLLFPFFVVSAKMIFALISLKRYLKTGVSTNENLPGRYLWTFTFLLLAAAYGLPALGLTLPWQAAGILFLAVILSGFYSGTVIRTFPYYREMYQQILAQKRYGTDMQAQVRQAVREQNQKYISQDLDIQTNKKGFEAFHELFVKRHRKILWKPVQRTTGICCCVLLGALLAVKINGQLEIAVNRMLMSALPFFCFIMYLCNRGTIYTQVLFMNCDHSMLTYSFYKKPAFILKLFQIRLRELVKMNLPPAIVIGGGLALLLYVTGGTDHGMNYLVLIFSVLAMSVFFSVHYLTCYYLLQPYNAYTDMVSTTYRLVTSGTYFVCFLLMRVQFDTLVFGSLAIVFCMGYCVIACLLVYRLADRTFRLRN